MLVAIIHGYFLKGTGSNLYVKNLCRELCRAGHEVMLVCQESKFDDVDFVASYVEFDGDNQSQFIRWERETDYPGKCTCYRPHIGELLPVFVQDNYSGYVVKELTRLTEPEIEVYLDKNQRALMHLFTQRSPDLVISNHTIMQPVYTARACALLTGCQHYMVVHGSCLNFSVRKSELLQAYAQQAIAGSERIIFVSDFSRQEFLEFFHYAEAIAAKAFVIPAGVDLDEFIPLSNEAEKRQRVAKCLEGLTTKSRTQHGRTSGQKREFIKRVSCIKGSKELSTLLAELELSETDNWSTDGDAVDNLRGMNWLGDKVILYYGKYLWTKGVHLLLAAIPLVLMRHPEAYFILVGFGSFRYYLEALVGALSSGRRDVFLNLLSRATEFSKDVDMGAITYVDGLLEKLTNQEFAESYFSAARSKMDKQVIFTGFMEHAYLRDMIACSDITVAPSIFPEAFGLVAVEALACGIIPLQTNHSGFTEIINDYSGEFHDIFRPFGLKPLQLTPELVLNLANNISALLNCYERMHEDERTEIRQRARMVVERKYSWQVMAEQFLTLASLDKP